jgi:hypothetical protein
MFADKRRSSPKTGNRNVNQRAHRNDVLGFAFATEVVFVKLSEVHVGPLSHAGEDFPK